jgi:hypothetical protein
MSWIRKLLGIGHEYRGNGYCFRVKCVVREVVSVEYSRGEYSLTLGGERFGKRWESIAVSIPQDVDREEATQIASDLAIGFEAMNCAYIINRKVAIDIIPEREIQAAIVELKEMGYQIDILPDGKIRQSKVMGAPHQDLETIKKQTPRIMQLIQTVHGKRTRFEILAKSKHFLS